MFMHIPPPTLPPPHHFPDAHAGACPVPKPPQPGEQGQAPHTNDSPHRTGSAHASAIRGVDTPAGTFSWPLPHLHKVNEGLGRLHARKHRHQHGRCGEA
jgi:hypothetical protein